MNTVGQTRETLLEGFDSIFLPQMNNAWENLNKTWKERLEKLEDAMQAAVQYQDTLQVRGWGMPTKEIRALLSLVISKPGAE